MREHEAQGRFQHVVVTQEGRLYGVIRVNTGLWRGLEVASTPVTVGEMASRDFTIVRDDAIAFDVIERMWRKHAFMAIVVKGAEFRTATTSSASSPRSTSPIWWRAA